MAKCNDLYTGVRFNVSMPARILKTIDHFRQDSEDYSDLSRSKFLAMAAMEFIWRHDRELNGDDNISPSVFIF